MKTKLPRMDIYAKRGTKVILDSPNYGYPYQQNKVKELLEVGMVYTVDYTEVNSNSTDVFLIGFSHPFNSVFFGSLNPEDIKNLG